MEDESLKFNPKTGVRRKTRFKAKYTIVELENVYFDASSDLIGTYYSLKEFVLDMSENGFSLRRHRNDWDSIIKTIEYELTQLVNSIGAPKPLVKENVDIFNGVMRDVDSAWITHSKYILVKSVIEIEGKRSIKLWNEIKGLNNIVRHYALEDGKLTDAQSKLNKAIDEVGVQKTWGYISAGLSLALIPFCPIVGVAIGALLLSTNLVVDQTMGNEPLENELNLVQHGLKLDSLSVTNDLANWIVEKKAAKKVVKIVGHANKSLGAIFGVTGTVLNYLDAEDEIEKIEKKLMDVEWQKDSVNKKKAANIRSLIEKTKLLKTTLESLASKLDNNDLQKLLDSSGEKYYEQISKIVRNRIK